MYEEIMRYCRNFFTEDERYYDTWTVENHSIDLPFMQTDQLMLIEGGLATGVYRYGKDEIPNGTFKAWITPLFPPKKFLDLCEEIKAWQAKYGDISSPAMSPYNSESFGGYSYSKGGSAGEDGNGSASWQDVFGKRLSVWRKK